MTDKDPKDYPPPSMPDAPPQSPPGPGSPYRAAPVQPGYAEVPRKKSGGFGRGFGAGLGFALGFGVVALAGMLLSGLLLMASLTSVANTATNSRASTELATIWGSPSAEHTLRAIQMTGPILNDATEGGLLVQGIYGNEVAKMIDDLDADEASGLLLLINTPGGAVGGSKAIADAVLRYQERTSKPVLVHVTGMSASGGVYATATADKIVADHGALVGSIGIISGPFQRYQNVTAIGSTIITPGVEAEQITQEYLSRGRGKDFGNPYRDMTEQERAQWEEMLDLEYGNFVKQVSEHRGIAENTIREEMGAGIFATSKAKEYGLIDDVKGRHEFYRYAAQEAGIDPDNTRVEVLKDTPGFLSSLLGAERMFGRSPVVAQGAGITPAVSAALCSPMQILAYHGSLDGVCR